MLRPILVVGALLCCTQSVAASPPDPLTADHGVRGEMIQALQADHPYPKGLEASEHYSGSTMRIYDAKARQWQIVFVVPISGKMLQLHGGAVGERIVLACAALQPYRSPVDRSGVDDPDAADRLLLWHPFKTNRGPFTADAIANTARVCVAAALVWSRT